MTTKKQNNHPFAIVRAREGLTQPELAEKLGVVDKYISQIETGKRRVSLNIAKKMHSLYGDRIDWLIGQSDFQRDEYIVFHEIDKSAEERQRTEDLIDIVLKHRDYELLREGECVIITNDIGESVELSKALYDHIIADIINDAELKFVQHFLQKKREHKIQELLNDSSSE